MPAPVRKPAAGPWPLDLLVDLPNWVGDHLMALPAVARIAAANTAGRTVLHVRPAVGRLTELLLPGSTVVSCPTKTPPFLAAVRLLRDHGRFDLAVTLRNAWRAKICVRLVGRRAWGSAGSGGALLHRTFPRGHGAHQLHDADPLLGALGLEPPAAGPRLALPPVLAAEAAPVLAELAPGRRVGLAPAAAWGPSKRWPADRFGRLVRVLSARGLEPLLVIGPGEEEHAAAVAMAAGGPLPVAGPDLDVAGLAGVVAGLDVLVSNDSGPMHLAAAFGTPVVGLFGPTDPHRTGPSNPGDQIVRRDLECAPCRRPRCPLGHHACLEDIGVEEVAAAVARVI